ncbi:short-chain dehydrogenase [Pseudoalteromonas luteoviolacea]|uniref:Short-chain dehydrogenase n=1 Tax=Pseudoalteromonas luteoviolacea TaxID=43657 RepID=A0A1C0TR73_9GAMM|nr:SDR family oxidoreductase [Pseudoalteromonas luteoviolacea]OCQ21457.1 short-chain dehydrogenase [Pseudoalteromonas luteoviolacea]
MNTPLLGKVALVTGAARNMGRAFAYNLAEQGCDVIVHYHSEASLKDAEKTAKLINDLGRKSLIIQGDISRASVAENLFTQALEAFGKIDIVVNNAGAVLKKSFIDYTEEEFDSLFNINCKGAFFIMQNAAKKLEDNGRVINIGTSLLGAFTGGYALYAGSKAPLEQFTRALAKEVGARGITVNTICPGPIDTAFFHAQEDPQSVAYLSAASVSNRLGKVEDIVPMVSFLASDQSQWTTGQTLFVNGGFVAR